MNVVLWVLQVLLAIMFTGAGVMKSTSRRTNSSPGWRGWTDATSSSSSRRVRRVLIA